MKDKVTSIRLTDEMRAELKTWADQDHRKMGPLIYHILADALAKHQAESFESGSPASDSLHRPTVAVHHASQAESVG